MSTPAIDPDTMPAFTADIGDRGKTLELRLDERRTLTRQTLRIFHPRDHAPDEVIITAGWTREKLHHDWRFEGSTDHFRGYWKATCALSAWAVEHLNAIGNSLPPPWKPARRDYAVQPGDILCSDYGVLTKVASVTATRCKTTRGHALQRITKRWSNQGEIKENNYAHEAWTVYPYETNLQHAEHFSAIQ